MLAIQQLFPIQILLIFLRFELLPNFIFQWYITNLKPGSSTEFFLLFSFLVLTKCQVLNLRVGRSLDQVLQRAYWSRSSAVPKSNLNVIEFSAAVEASCLTSLVPLFLISSCRRLVGPWTTWTCLN